MLDFLQGIGAAIAGGALFIVGPLAAVLLFPIYFLLGWVDL